MKKKGGRSKVFPKDRVLERKIEKEIYKMRSYGLTKRVYYPNENLYGLINLLFEILESLEKKKKLNNIPDSTWHLYLKITDLFVKSLKEVKIIEYKD